MRILRIASICVILLSVQAPAQARQLTVTERQRLVAHLEMTAKWLSDEVSGLSQAQLTFKRSHDEWSIAQVIDHLLVVGPIYWDDLQTALKSPPATSPSEFSDADILWYGIDRGNPEKAIASEVPAARFRDLRTAMAEFHKHQTRLIQFVKTTTANLRAHVVPRQRSDAYQWALLISTHEQRHILQIRAIKDADAFPRR